MGMLGLLLNGKSVHSVTNGSLLYKQLMHPSMDYACPTWRSTTRTHARRLYLWQSKCLRFAAGAPWYASIRHIQIGSGFSAVCRHQSPECELWHKVLMENPVVWQLRRYAEWVLPVSPELNAKGGICQQASRGHRTEWSSRSNKSCSSVISWMSFGYHDWFNVIFSHL